MSIGSVIQQLFGGAPNPIQAPMTPQQQANPQNVGMVPTGAANPGGPLPGTQATQKTDNNGVIPTNQTPGAAGAPGNSDSLSPLDTFNKVWETVPTDPKANQPIFSGLDPKKLMESASQVDFSKAVTPEMMAKINAGGEGAMQALIEAMSKVGQTVYAQSAFATTKIVDKALTEQQTRFEQSLPSMVKKFSANEGLITENPILNHPAVAPLKDALTQQLQAKNPNASSAEIQAQVVDYFKAMGTAFKVQPPAQKGSKTSADPDWDKFFS